MAVGASLVAFLGLDSSRFSKGLNKASQRSKQFTQTINKQFKAVAAFIAAAFSGRAIKSIVDTSDQIAKQAANTGFSTKKFQEYSIALQQADIEQSGFIKSVQQISRSIGEASKGGTSYIKALASIGISYRDLENASPEEQFDAVINALEQTENLSIRNSAAAILIGRTWRDVGTLMTEGLTKILRGAEGITLRTDTALISAAVFNDSLLRFVTNFSNIFANKIGPFLVYLSDAMESLIKNAYILGRAFNGVIGALAVIVAGKTIKALITVAKAIRSIGVMAAFASAAIAVIPTLVIGLGAFIGTFFGEFKDLGGATIDYIVTKLDVLKSKWSLNWLSMRVTFSKMVNGLKAGWTNLVNKMLDLLEIAKLRIDNIWLSIKLSAIKSFEIIPNILVKAINKITGLVPASWSKQLGLEELESVTLFGDVQKQIADAKKLNQLTEQAFSTSTKIFAAPVSDSLVADYSAAFNDLKLATDANDAASTKMGASFTKLKTAVIDTASAVKDTLFPSITDLSGVKLEAKSITEENTAAIDKETAATNRLAEANISAQASYASMLEGATNKTAEFSKLGTKVFDDFNNALIDFTKTGKFNFKGFANSIIQDIIKINIRAATSKIFSSLFAGGNAGSFLGSLFGGFRAGGGPVGANQSYVVGENGPEIFTPGTNGSITPNGGGGGNTTNVAVNVSGNVDDRAIAQIRSVISNSSDLVGQGAQFFTQSTQGLALRRG